MENKKQTSAYYKLSDKRRKFVDEYIKDCNGTQAAIRAGYSKKTANEQASRLLANVTIYDIITAKLEAIAKTNEISVDWVVKKQVEIIERCMQASPVYDDNGDRTGEYKFDSTGANQGLRLLAKHLGMDRTKVEVNVPFSIIWDESELDNAEEV